jgi:Zn-finger nucleic acid-binding protein
MNARAQIEAMKCPCCQERLVMSERQDIEIDYCPSCRGVWLDRGELDKIIQRAVEAPAAAPAHHAAAHAAGAPVAHPAPFYPYPPPYYGHHKRRKHWLELLFD